MKREQLADHEEKARVLKIELRYIAGKQYSQNVISKNTFKQEMKLTGITHVRGGIRDICPIVQGLLQHTAKGKNYKVRR